MSSSTQDLERANTAFLTNSVLDLFSLKSRVIVVTGGARGIGLSLCFAIAEAGGVVAIIDNAAEPHEHYSLLQKICPQAKIYK